MRVTISKGGTLGSVPLKGKVVIIGMGNSLRGDDGVGSILASRIKNKVGFDVFDVGISPENYLEKIIQAKPDTIVIIDAADFSGLPGEFKVLKAQDIKTCNFFATHNASISLTINYLQNNLKVDIMALLIQPKTIIFGEILSPEVTGAISRLEDWFYEASKDKECRM